jgi:hypothetical protein
MVAAAALQHADRRGMRLPDDLLIWSLASRRSAAPADGAPVDGPSRLPEILEAATARPQRRTSGLYVTPAWLADKLVTLALDGLVPEAQDVPAHGGQGPAVSQLTVCDPACGGGAFLLAAARALHSRGIPRRDVVERCLWGADIDPVGLATAEAALTLWAGVKPTNGRLVLGDTLADGARLWADAGHPSGAGEAPFDAVVGNPPFLNQLAAATARSESDRAQLRRRFGDAVQPYTDTAWLFLLAGCDLVRSGGRIALIQPLSLVAARDATRVRAALDDRAHLRELWVEDRSYFAAHVRVCCPVLEVRAGREHGAGRGSRSVPVGTTAATPNGAASGGWAERLADAIGVPRVTVRSAVRLGDRAEVTAGFRDEYYGLVPYVREAPDDSADAAAGAIDAGRENGLRPLITAGVLDWGRSAWGERPSRFARRRWEAPVVDTTAAIRQPASQSRQAAARAAAWLVRTASPKVVVATQTKVVEAAVDESGAWVPSVPALVVLPAEPDELWLLAAALASPTATVWLLRRAPGTALARHALRITARDLAGLPLPDARPAWEAAAAALRTYASATGAATSAALESYCRAIARAYDAPACLERWWRRRLMPAGSQRRPPPA